MPAFNIILTGEGGQGVVTAGTILSQTVMDSGYNVIMSELHGLSQRGGSITVEVRIGEIYGPISFKSKYNLLLGFEPIEAMRILEQISYPMDAVVNSEKISPIYLGIRDLEYPDVDAMLSNLPQCIRLRRIDASRIARDAGSVKATNIVMLGTALEASVPGLTLEGLENAIRSRFSGKLLQLNLDALHLAMGKMERELPG
ncbi:MAG: indolepyruvate oxidoreductase subunit beta [Candidatus Thermoplasmatota archaeon]|nr:indolepyruvate oxidoreductase subunit beta [Candidatus Thermoplasmatota archaeon]MCL5665752.1 indolepyruvate oxidoreductase subunit beta [Candidatus Thermoplasmatota archaeon]